jgi:hypothetical protein
VSDYGAIIAAHAGNDYYQAASPPVGPYFVRQALAERSREEVLAFHDSDDLSCWDRFGCLEAERARTGCDLIGSNELRFDELEGDVTAFRYPLDASAALGMAPGHALFFPTSMITRAGFFRAGGLSTDRAFAYDTQFLLRAFFSLKIRNVDKFLYVRRRRAGSLTTSPETGMGTPIRERLAARWEHDFEEVKSGRLTLEGSSLATCHAPGGDLRSGLRRLSPRG